MVERRVSEVCALPLVAGDGICGCIESFSDSGSSRVRSTH